MNVFRLNPYKNHINKIEISINFIYRISDR